MLGPAPAGRPGNGGSHWLPLADRAKRHTLKLEELAQHVGPDPNPSETMLDRLGKVNDFLEEVLMLVDDVRMQIGPRTPEAGLSGPLDTLSGSIQTAREEIGDLAYIIGRELLQQADEADQHQHRPHERALEDRRTLRRQSRTVENCLTKLRRHLDRLLEWLDSH